MNCEIISGMYQAARSYIAGAKIILSSDGIVDDDVMRHPTLPVIMCSAIAIEIQLKAILVCSNITKLPSDRHNLRDLFFLIPSQTREDITNHMCKELHITQNNINCLLEENKDVFKIWRYPYEHLFILSSPASLLDFSISLSNFIGNRYSIANSENGWLKSALAE